MKVILFALCALLSVLSTSAFPKPQEEVPSQCVDPTFACQDLQSAKLCRVVKTCIHDVWSYMHVPDSNDEVCDICKEMVKEARDQLLSNMTQEEIKEVFEGSCKLLPFKLVADACIKVVDEIIPQLIEMLASRMDPTMVCTVSGMCFPSSGENSIERHVLNFLGMFFLKPKNAQCDECTKMMTDVQEFMKISTQDEVKTYIEKFCHEKLPSAVCNIVIKSYFSEIYTYILSTAPEKLCSNAGVCPQKCELQDEKSKLNDNLTCEFCEHLLEHVKDLITANTTMEEFKTALLNFCKNTGKFANKCTELVNDYYDMLFTYIKNLDSKGMCTLMGLCQSGKCTKIPLVKLLPALEVRKRIPLVKLQPAVRVPSNDLDVQPLVRLIPAKLVSKKEMRETNDIFQKPQLPLERLSHPYPIFARDTECSMCKAFSFYLETDLSGDKTKEGVRTAINNICDKWMKNYPEYCTQLVKKYSMKMQLAIARGTGFEELCSVVKACPLEDKTHELKVKIFPSNIDNNTFCDICKEAMGEVEKQLSDPATKQKLKDLFGQVCMILPQSLKDDCNNFINQNIDVVIDILEQELKPDTFCPAIGLCPGSLRIAAPLRVKDLECDVCKDVVTSFRQKMQDPSAKEIVQTVLEEGCVRLPQSLADECKKFVDENIDTLMTLLVEELDPLKVCSVLKICTATIKEEKATEKLNDLECDLCKQVVTKVEDLIKDKRTEDEIKKALDKVCSYLPSSLSAKCEGFVNQYTDLLITLLAQELAPEMVCAALNVCPATVVKLEKAPKKLNDIECDLCKQVVTQLKNLIKDKSTEEEIQKALEMVCSFMPSSISAQCESFIEKYTELLFTLLVDGLEPDMVCAILNICPASVVEAEKVPPISDDLECDLCKQVVTELEDLIKDKKTEDEIQKALDKVCSYLPSSLSAKCEGFVNQYTELLITLLAQELDPDMVCAALKVCPEKRQLAEWQSKAKDVECQGCQYALHFLQEQLMNPDTQGIVKGVLEKMCDVLPETYAKNCEAFVDEYGSSLLVLIAQEIDPSTLCYEVKLCTNKTSILERTVSAGVSSLSSFRMDKCSVCTTVVDYLDKLIELDDVDKEISQLVAKVCTVVPSSFRSQCSSILEAYGPYILQMIGQMVDSKQVCQEIDLCPRASGHVHLIGGSKCTFGPSYWCQSTAHAAACKAEMFCKEKVWEN